METDALTLEDTAHLDSARTIARRGWGRVHPNPMVGCVIVLGGRVVAQGYHERFGGPHAEIVALEKAKSAAEGATAYVSLEPCDHDGKTPPCSMALVRAGVARVVYGVAEPGAEEGGGADTLRTHGLDVVGPVWDARTGRAENPAFFHAQRSSTPYVALKVAMTMDAKIAAGPGDRTRITGADAQHEVHRLRSGFDAVLIGTGTWKADDPRLTVRLVPPGRAALRRLVLDPRAELPTDAKLFEDVGEAPLHVFTAETAPEAEMERLEEAGAHVHPVPTRGNVLDLDAVMAAAGEIGAQTVLCEGGATLAAHLLRERRVQRFYLFVAPHTLGSEGVAAFPEDAATLDWQRFHPVGEPRRHGRDTLIVLDRDDG